MNELTFAEELEDLSSAEDFLNYFDVDYDPKVVHINRLHIMQRFHDYLEKGEVDLDELTDEGGRDVYRKLLTVAYQDFVDSDALTEKVFKVFRMQEPQSGFVSVEQLLSGS